MADGIGEGAGSNRGNRSGLIRLIPKAFLREENSDMNDAQKTVLGWAAVAVVASIVFCPYVVTDINTYPSFTAGVPSTESRTTSTEYGWVWDAPRNSSLDFGRLAMEWGAIVVGTLVLLGINSEKKVAGEGVAKAKEGQPPEVGESKAGNLAPVRCPDCGREVSRRSPTCLGRGAADSRERRAGGSGVQRRTPAIRQMVLRPGQ